MPIIKFALLALSLTLFSVGGYRALANTVTPPSDTVAVEQPIEAGTVVAIANLCRPQNVFCKKGTRWNCNRCVPDPKCVPQRIFCPIGTKYVCNACVRMCVPQRIICKAGYKYVCNRCVPNVGY